MVKKNSGMAIASLVLGIGSVLWGWISFFVLIVFSILAIVLGFFALSSIKHGSKLEGKGLAVGGIVLGFISLLAYFL